MYIMVMQKQQTAKTLIKCYVTLNNQSKFGYNLSKIKHIFQSDRIL